MKWSINKHKNLGLKPRSNYIHKAATQINQKLYCFPNKIAISPPTNPKSRTNEIPIYKKFMNLFKTKHKR